MSVRRVRISHAPFFDLTKLDKAPLIRLSVKTSWLENLQLVKRYHSSGAR